MWDGCSAYSIQRPQENSNRGSAKLTTTKRYAREKKITRIADRENSLEDDLAKAKGETKKCKQLYIQEQKSLSDLTSLLNQQKSEAKRWEDNYNRLYNQHVKLKRSKGLEMD